MAAGVLHHFPPNAVTLSTHGDSIWREVVQYASSHGAQLNEPDKRPLVDRVLRANGQTWPSARNLPDGFRFTIPPDVQQDILNYR